MTIAGKGYEHGLGSHAPGLIRLELDGQAKRFQAEVGVDAAAGEEGSVAFLAYADGTQVFDSGTMKKGDAAKTLDLSLEGVRSLILYMDAGRDGKTFDHANWANAGFTFIGAVPASANSPSSSATPCRSPRQWTGTAGNIHLYRVTEDHMRRAAHAMVETGMADYGYQYVNIDDCWMKKKGDEPYRSGTGAALPNAKFPDMKGMVDEIHSLGLKAGIYTSPGPWTCAWYVGAYQNEQAEIDQYVEWGFDFLKIRLVFLQQDRREGRPSGAEAALPADQQSPERFLARYRAQPLPIWRGRCLGMGQGRWRALLA